jgi:hypothetical protein
MADNSSTDVKTRVTPLNPDLNNNDVTDANPNSVNSTLNNNTKPQGPNIPPSFEVEIPPLKPAKKSAARFGRRR